VSDATANVTLELPLQVFSALRRSPGELGPELRLAAAIHWYGRGEVTLRLDAEQVTGEARIGEVQLR
jgi:hypothetical protein